MPIGPVGGPQGPQKPQKAEGTQQSSQAKALEMVNNANLAGLQPSKKGNVQGAIKALQSNKMNTAAETPMSQNTKAIAVAMKQQPFAQ